MLTIRQVREVVEGLRLRMPDAPLPPESPEPFFGSNRTLEETIAADLANLLSGQCEQDPATLPHLKMRLMFAAECLRQTEEACPELGIPGAEIPALLHHWMIDQWPDHGMAWALATFGPRRKPL